MTKLSPLYVLRETPPAHQYMGAPLGLLGRNVNAVNRVTINSISSEPTYNDAYIRIINDELFDATPVPFDSMGFQVCVAVRLPELTNQYAFSYVKQTIQRYTLGQTKECKSAAGQV